MQDFITDATTRFGVSESVAQAAAKFILQFVQKQLAEIDFQEMLDKFPGASELLKSTDNAAGGGSLIGALTEELFVGDASTDALTLANQMNAAGIGSDQLAAFGKLFLDHAKKNVGDGLVEKVLDHAPNLRALMD